MEKDEDDKDVVIGNEDVGLEFINGEDEDEGTEMEGKGFN